MVEDIERIFELLRVCSVRSIAETLQVKKSFIRGQLIKVDRDRYKQIVRSRNTQRKLSDRQVEAALQLIFKGQSVRAIARSYGVDSSTLIERLNNAYGQRYKNLIKSKGKNTCTAIAAYSQHPSQRTRQAAEEWLSANLDALMALEMECPQTLLTPHQEQSFSYGINAEWNVESIRWRAA